MEIPPPPTRSGDRVDLAKSTPRRAEITSLCRESALPVLQALASNPHLEERDVLFLLERKDLPAEVVSALGQRADARRSAAVQLALVRHPKSPRQVSLGLIKGLYVFDLLRVTQTPGVPAEVQLAAEEAILRKTEGLPRGERITLARRGTGRLAASLLITSDLELIRAALENPYLTEGHLVKLLARTGLPPALVEYLAQHEQWSNRYNVRLALIRNPLTPLARVLTFLPDMAVGDLRDTCLDRRLPEPLRKYLKGHCADRLKKSSQGA